jgi:hypothetical protein
MNEYDKQLFNETLRQRLFHTPSPSLDISFSKTHRKETIRKFKEIYNMMWKHPEKINWRDDKVMMVKEFIKEPIEKSPTNAFQQEDRCIIRTKRKKQDMRKFVSKQIINVQRD